MGQASNNFSEGMIKDINPINVPATALTDCKNGTIITYNGNEFSLQNDMGNALVTNANNIAITLNEGFVPVGMKEYNGILYIVSYNDTTKQCEIGSFPSTKIVETSETQEPSKEFYSEILGESGYKSISYKELSKNIKRQQLTGKLNPGDEIAAFLQETYPHSTIDYYILTDDNVEVDVTAELEKIKSISGKSLELHYLPWTVPGALYGKERFLTPEALNISVTSENKLIISVVIEDDLLKQELENDCALKITIGDTEILLSNHYKAGNGQVVYWNVSDVITVGEYKCAPMIYNASNTYNIYYDNLETTVKISEIEKTDTTGFTVGSTTWQYDIMDGNLTIMFDTLGVVAKNNVELTLEYSLYKLVQDNAGIVQKLVLDQNGVEYKNRSVDGWSQEYPIGEIVLPVEEYITDVNPLRLFAEDIYILELVLKSDNVDNIQKKFIFASELVNDFDYDDFDNITFSDVINKYRERIEKTEVILDNINTEDKGTTFAMKDTAFTAWTTKCSNIDNATTFLDDATYQQCKNGISADIYQDLKNTTTGHFKILSGPFWSGFLGDMQVNASVQTNKTANISFTKNNISGNCSFKNINFDSQIDSKLKFSPLQSTPLTVWNYSDGALQVKKINFLNEVYWCNKGDNAIGITVLDEDGAKLRSIQFQNSSYSAKSTPVSVFYDNLPEDTDIFVVKMTIQNKKMTLPNNANGGFISFFLYNKSYKSHSGNYIGVIPNTANGHDIDETCEIARNEINVYYIGVPLKNKNATDGGTTPSPGLQLIYLDNSLNKDWDKVADYVKGVVSVMKHYQGCGNATSGYFVDMTEEDFSPKESFDAKFVINTNYINNFKYKGENLFSDFSKIKSAINVSSCKFFDKVPTEFFGVKSENTKTFSTSLGQVAIKAKADEIKAEVNTRNEKINLESSDWVTANNKYASKRWDGSEYMLADTGSLDTQERRNIFGILQNSAPSTDNYLQVWTGRYGGLNSKWIDRGIWYVIGYQDDSQKIDYKEDV